MILSKEILNKNFFLSNLFIYLTQALKLFFPLLILPICTNLIGLEEFGRISVELSYVILISLVVDFSVNVYGPSIIASMEKNDRNYTIYKMSGLKFTIAIIFSIILIFSNFIFPDFYSISLLILFFCFITGVMIDCNWVFLAEKSFSRLFLSQFFGIISSLSIIYFLYLNELQNIYIVSLLLSLPLLMTSLFSFFLLDIKSRYFSKKINTSFLNFGLFISEGKSHINIFISQMVSAIYTNSGPIILSFIIGPEVAGIWFIINRITTAISSISIVPYRALFPDIVKSWASKSKSHELNYSIVLYCLITFIFYILIYYFVDNVSEIFFESTDVISLGILSLMIFWTLSQYSGPVLTNYLIVKKKDMRLFIYTLSSLIILIILSYPLTLSLKISGWILTMILSQSVIAIGTIGILIENIKTNNEKN